MIFRRATLGDCALLAELNHQLIRDEGHRNRMTVPELEQRLRGWLAVEYAAVVFEDGGTVVAYALYREQPEEIYLRQLFVVRNRRRQGIGRAAFEILRSKIWPQNKRLTVDVLVQNSSALAFWRSIGYRDYCLTLEILPVGRSIIVRKVSNPTRPPSGWDDPSWAQGEVAEISHFRPESSAHRPQTFVRLLHDARGIHGLFQVHDRYVRCVRTEYGSEVWKDSCVEFFVKPKADAGYFNFEFNCGGAFLCSYIVDPTRTPDGFKEFTKVPAEIGRQIQVRASLPRVVEPEIAEVVNWSLQFFIPFSLLEKYVGPLGEVSGQTWRGNFFKCAEDNSHPHWAAWSPVDELNFHLPHCFGEIRWE